MERQGELFNGYEYEDLRIEAFGEQPIMTKEQFLSFCDNLHDCGEEAYALHLFNNYGDLDGIPIKDIIDTLDIDI